MNRESRSGVGRRDVLKGALAASFALAGGEQGSAGEQPRSAAPRNPALIAEENARPGAIDWQLTYVRLDRTDGYRSPGVEGYCSRQSVGAGEKLDIMISAQPAGEVTIDIFRMGYYGGLGARRMTTLGPVACSTQPLPEVGERRLRECRWEPAVSLTIPDDWPSGVYLGRLSRVPRADGTVPWQSYVVFIVRDERPADVLFQCSDNTWQAYNRWPDRFSLYDDGSQRDWSSLPGIDVSFDRPYGRYRQIYNNPQSVGSGEFLLWEYPLCYWLEQHGYDVTYCSNSDLLTPERAARCKTFISVGHDEYWDLRQYESVRSAIDQGANALFLSGNSVCWVTPFSPSSSGVPNRVITRAAPYGGLMMGGETKHLANFDSVGPDEGLLMGVRNIRPVNGGGDWTVALPDHWLFAGTGMRAGDGIRGLVGWEFHGEPADIEGIEVVAEGIALNGGTRPVPWASTIHPGPRGNFVFNASTIFWAQGLSNPPGHMLPWSHSTRPHGADPRVQQMMRNLLERAIG